MRHPTAKRCQSHAGLEEVAKRGREQLADHQVPAETGGEAETKGDVLDSESGAGQDTEPLRPSTTGTPRLNSRFITRAGVIVLW